MRLPRGLAAFRHRNFRLFWTGQLLSVVGTWMQALAQDWLVLQLTNDPFILGLVSAFQFLPVLVFGLFGGLIADLVPKRKTLYATQGSAMILALVLAALTYTHTVQVWHILVLANLLGFVNAVDMPTRQSFVVEMVGREHVANAVALNSAAFNMARIVGPAIAGILIGLLGVVACFTINGVSYIAVLTGLALMRDEELETRPTAQMERTVRAVLDNLAEGLAYVRRTSTVLAAIAVVGVVSTMGMNFRVLVPVLARDVLQVGATGFGLLMAAIGVGSLLSALLIAFNGRPSVRLLLTGAFGLGALETVLGIVHIFPVSMVAMFGIGASAIAMTATANTLIQLLVPDVLRGRVMAVYTTVFAGSSPIGGLLMGAIASTLSVSVAFVIGGASSMAAAAGAYVLNRRPSSPQQVPARVEGPSL